jgi:membrane-bound metal-dependent hydrolase YbcI (DUF457 family)
MPLAVTHIIVPIIALELLKDSSKSAAKFFSRKYAFLVGVAGLLPDIDLHIVRIASIFGRGLPNTELGHRILFHNIWVPLGFFLFFILFYRIIPKYTNKPKKSKARFRNFGKVFIVLCIGWVVHLTLDATLTGYVMPFYPLSDYLANYNLVGWFEMETGVPMLTTLVSIDALLMFFWLWHEEAHHYIKDYF